jgi:hypothetical protein
MDNDKTIHETQDVGVEDVLPLRSRVSWGAIFAGAVMAMAVYLVFTLLGGAIGLSVSNDADADALSTGAAVWAVITTVIAMFVGGWVTSQCTVGENKMEAVVHGIIAWGMVLFMTLWLVTAGMSSGFSAMWGLASFSNDAANGNWQTMARQAGVSQDTIQQWEQEAAQARDNASQAANDPAAREEARDYATAATWYTLLGTLLSMGAAIGGALVGAGPSFRLLGTPVLARRTTIMHS